MTDYIPLSTIEQKTAFAQVTSALPVEIRQTIWKMSLDDHEPPAPKTPLRRNVRRLAERGRDNPVSKNLSYEVDSTKLTNWLSKKGYDDRDEAYFCEYCL